MSDNKNIQELFDQLPPERQQAVMMYLQLQIAENSILNSQTKTDLNNLGLRDETPKTPDEDEAEDEQPEEPEDNKDEDEAEGEQPEEPKDNKDEDEAEDEQPEEPEDNKDEAEDEQPEEPEDNKNEDEDKQPEQPKDESEDEKQNGGYQMITDPLTGQTYDIHSNNAKLLLKSYLNMLKKYRK